MSILLLAALLAAPPAPAARAEHSDKYEIAVDDPYRWMEESASPRVGEWVAAQNAHTRTTLDASADYRPLRDRMLELTRGRRRFPPIARGELLFLAEGNPNATSDSTLQVIDTRSGKTRTLVEQADLIRHSTSGVFPSPDGRLVVYRTARGPSSWLTLRVVETRSGRVLPDRLEGGFGSYASAAWLADGSGFFYARFERDPAKSDLEQVRRFHRLYFHRIGDEQAKDKLIAEAKEEPTRRFFPAVTDDGKTLVVMTALGTESETRVLVGPAAASTQLTDLFPSRKSAVALIGSAPGRLFFMETLGAPRGKIIEVDLATRAERTLIEATDDALVYADLVAERLIVFRYRDARPRVTIHTLDGAEERELALPPLATVWGPATGGVGFVGRRLDRHAYFLTNGLSDPGTLHRLDPRTGERTVWRAPDEKLDPARFTATQVFFRSYDGTRIPMLLAWRADLDRSKPQPVWMYAYGALGWPAFPWYQPHIVAWMERGGIYAMPGVRGGGEYGESWHRAGIAENRGNVLEDFLAAAEWLADTGVTTRRMLVSNGGSISGALEAEALVVRPDLFAAAVIDIPVTDLLRYDRFTGAGMWVPELGASTDPRQVISLLRHSPYHLIRDGRCYPPTLVTAGQSDETAVPSHSYKFVAALQNANACKTPILLNALENTGHTFGATPEQTAETWARQLVFVNEALRAAVTRDSP